MLKKLRNQEGFTLLELLVVIVIIGILALIIVPGLASGPKRARDTQRKTDLRSVKNALETYYNDANPNSYPSTTYGSSDTTGLGAILVPQYIPHLPIDPKNGQADPQGGNYGYVYNMTGTSYTLSAHLENTTDSQITTAPDTYTINSQN